MKETKGSHQFLNNVKVMGESRLWNRAEGDRSWIWVVGMGRGRGPFSPEVAREAPDLKTAANWISLHAPALRPTVLMTQKDMFIIGTIFKVTCQPELQYATYIDQCYHLLKLFCVPGPVPSTSPALSHLILMATLWGWHFSYYFLFTHEKTEAPRSCPNLSDSILLT